MVITFGIHFVLLLEIKLLEIKFMPTYQTYVIGQIVLVMYQVIDINLILSSLQAVLKMVQLFSHVS